MEDISILAVLLVAFLPAVLKPLMEMTILVKRADWPVLLVLLTEACSSKPALRSEVLRPQ